MARTNPPPVDDLEPERRIARLFSQKHKVKPPVPINALIEELANVEYANFPGSWDALLLTRQNAKPQIVVSADVTNTRRLRFTLAHELGHLIIPWSVGAMFCHANVSYHVDDILLGSLEAEANRFASELLFPGTWVQQRLQQRNGAMADFVMKLAEESQVSPIVAVLGTGRFCPAETLLMIVTANGSIKYKSAATQCLWSVPERWNDTASREMLAAGAVISTVDYDGGQLVAVELPINHTNRVAAPSKSSREVLESILDDVCIDDAQKSTWRQSIRGIGGYVNNRASDMSPAGIGAAIRQRLVGRKDLRAVTAHRMFDEFVQAAAYELALKKGTT